MRRSIRLPEADEDYLNHSGLRWGTVVEGATRWLLVYRAPIAQGYNVAVADRAFSIDTGYPSSQIDMVYFHPPLSRADGRPIGRPWRLSMAERSSGGRGTEPQPIHGDQAKMTYRHKCFWSINGWKGSSQSDDNDHISSVDGTSTRSVEEPLISSGWL